MPRKTNYNEKSLLNLKNPPEILTPEQMRAAQVKGGIVSSQNRKKRKLFSEIIAEIGSRKLSKRKMSENCKKLADMYGIDGDVTADMLVILAQYDKATDKGDTDAARYLRDTSGQSPAQMVRVGTLDAQFADLSQVPDDVLQAELAALDAGDE